MKLINQLAPCFGRFLVWVFFMGGGGGVGGKGFGGGNEEDVFCLYSVEF